MEGEKQRFIRKHAQEIQPLLESSESLDSSPDMLLERFETKVLTWENPHSDPNGKRVLFEASEPIAYQTVRALLDEVMHDKRCEGVVLLTDNIAGKKFVEESKEIGLQDSKTQGIPLFTDIPGNIDSALIVSEPSNSPDKTVAYSASSVFGNPQTKLFYLLEGLPGYGSRELFKDTQHMDRVEKVFVGSPLAEQLVRASLPALAEKVEVAGSVLLASKKDSFPTPETKKDIRNSTLKELQISEDSIVLFYSGFPSSDYEEKTEGETLNQRTFKKTYLAVVDAATADHRMFALIIREHPRARGAGDSLSIPEDLTENIKIIVANGPDYNYDAIANASDFIVCQSTSSEVTIAPHRGAVAVVSGYKDAGMQAQHNERIFGEEGVGLLKNFPDIVYADSPDILSRALTAYTGIMEPLPLPPNAVSRITAELLT